MDSDRADRSSSTPRRVLITGAASGIGLETARQLARAGDRIVVADRDAEGGRAAVDRIRSEGGHAGYRALDLADLSSIREFADAECAEGRALDVLVNDAGILPPMNRATTRDGFELEFGIAHLGHFALTGGLLPALLRSARPRVVSVASVAHKSARLDLDDLQMERGYTSSRCYGATKLACLMFALELDRRAKAADSPLVSVAAHPGISKTPIAAGWEREGRRRLWDRLELFGYRLSMRLFGQTAAEGARALALAATEPGARGGEYFGPTGFGEFGGPPGLARPGAHALDASVAARLWEASETLTGIRIELATRPG